MKEAMFYEKTENKNVKCKLCNHFCVIKQSHTGLCNVRKNIDGKLFSNVYCRIVAKNIDPVEKKPLYHFLPGSYTYSISTIGCNFKCLNCQNHEISQRAEIIGYNMTSANMINEVFDNHLPSISYTYTEPTVYYETAKDLGILALEKGIKNIFVSNGFMSKELISDLKNWLHAINVDLKSFNNDFYKKICKASLKPVIDNIAALKESGIWVEITTLIIPGLNDTEQELRNIAKFIKNVDPSIPWHVSAFYPTYLLTQPPATPPDTVKNARLIGLSEGLKYVYTGNIRDNTGGNTYCHNCGALLIERKGYYVEIIGLSDGKCKNCNKRLEGIFH